MRLGMPPHMDQAIGLVVVVLLVVGVCLLRRHHASVDRWVDGRVDRLFTRLVTSKGARTLAEKPVSDLAEDERWASMRPIVQVLAGVLAVLHCKRAVLQYEAHGGALPAWTLAEVAAYEAIAAVVIAWASRSRARLRALHRAVAVACPALRGALGVWPPTGADLFESATAALLANTFIATLTTPSFSEFVALRLGPTVINLLVFCPPGLRDGLTAAQAAVMGAALCAAPAVNAGVHACRRWWPVLAAEGQGGGHLRAWGASTALAAVLTSSALLLLPTGALQSVTKLLASPETHLTSLPARLCALGCVAAVAAWRLPADNRRSLRVPVHPVVRARRARAMENVSLFTRMVGVPVLSFYLLYAWDNDPVDVGIFLLRFAIIMVFSHTSHRTAVNASWPLLLLVSVQFMVLGRDVALPRRAIFATCIGLHAGASIVQESRLSYALYSLVVFLASAWQLEFDVVGTLVVATIAAVAGVIFRESMRKLERACAEHDAAADVEAATALARARARAQAEEPSRPPAVRRPLGALPPPPAADRPCDEEEALVEEAAWMALPIAPSAAAFPQQEEQPQQQQSQQQQQTYKNSKSATKNIKIAKKKRKSKRIVHQARVMSEGMALRAHIAVQYPMSFIAEETSGSSDEGEPEVGGESTTAPFSLSDALTYR